MIPFISNLFNLPVTRKEVLKRARKYKSKAGLCFAIDNALRDYNINATDYIDLFDVFPHFNNNNAILLFGAKDGGYWWDKHIWNTGRMAFLNWLIKQYKDDKTNLREL